jgi:hypothetical protein
MGRNKREMTVANMLDVRLRVDKGISKLTFIQYFIFLIVSLTFTVLSG